MPFVPTPGLEEGNDAGRLQLITIEQRPSEGGLDVPDGLFLWQIVNPMAMAAHVQNLPRNPLL